MKILVVDVGGSHVKCAATGHKNPVKFKSGPKLTPGPMVRKVMKITRGWCFDAVSIGYPGVVRRGRIVREPRNLGGGWVGFDFREAFACGNGPCRQAAAATAAKQPHGAFRARPILDLPDPTQCPRGAERRAHVRPARSALHQHPALSVGGHGAEGQ